MLQELSVNSICLYTNVLPGVVYRIINTVYANELYESLPLLFPLANLIDMGITNYYDMYGCLSQEVNEVYKFNNNPDKKNKIIP